MVVNPNIYQSSKWKRLATVYEVVIIHDLLVQADKTTFLTYVNIDTLAHNCKMCRRSVINALSSLEKKGCVIVIRNYKHFLIKGHNVIKRKNQYDLSFWRDFCCYQKKAKDDLACTSQEKP